MSCPPCFTSRTQQYPLWATLWCQQDVVRLHGSHLSWGLLPLFPSWIVSNWGQVDRNVNLHCVIVWIYFTQWGFIAVVLILGFFLSHTSTRALFQRGAGEPKRYDRPTLHSTNPSHSGSDLLIANTNRFPTIGDVMCLAMHETKFKLFIGSYWQSEENDWDFKLLWTTSIRFQMNPQRPPFLPAHLHFRATWGRRVGACCLLHEVWQDMAYYHIVDMYLYMILKWNTQ